MANDPIERINKLISDSGITNYVLANETGLSQASVSRITRGEQKPGRKSIKAIAEYFEVNDKWLATGNGDKENTNKPSNSQGIEDLLAEKIFHRLVPILKQNRREQNEELKEIKELIHTLNQKIENLKKIDYHL